MRLEEFYVMGAWANRADTPETCAAQLLTTWDMLAACHPAFAFWYVLSKQRPNPVFNPPAPPLPISRDPGALSDLFHRNLQRDDLGAPFFTGGYNVHLVNNQTGEPGTCSLSLLVGVTDAPVSPGGRGVTNIVKLNFARRSRLPEGLLAPAVLLQALRAIITAWRPDHALIGESELLQQVTGSTPPSPLPPGYVFETPPPPPHPGWAVYLSDPLAGAVAAPEGVTVETCPERGALWIAEREHFSVADKVARVKAVNRALAPLRPVPSQMAR